MDCNVLDTIDNFETLREVMEFTSPEVFYVVSIIQRAKDFKDGFSERKHKEHFCRHFFIRSLEEYDKLKPKIIEECEKNNARAYFGLDAKNMRKVLALQIQEEVQLLSRPKFDGSEVLKYRKNFDGIPRMKECSESQLRMVHIDLDKTGSEGLDLCSMLHDEIQPFGKFTVLTTINGYHFFRKIRAPEGNVNVQELGNLLAKFRAQNDLQENELELKMNSMTLLYYKRDE